MRSDALLLGYNTNGLAHHDPYDAVELLAEIGYRSVAITLDHGPLNPFHADFYRNIKQMGRLLDRLGMRSVIETGARFLLDPRLKHEPTLVSAERRRTAAARRVSLPGDRRRSAIEKRLRLALVGHSATKQSTKTRPLRG